MYSKRLIDFARSLDRVKVGVYFARNDLKYALEDVHSDADEEKWNQIWRRPDTYLSAMEASIPALEEKFYEQLAEESKQLGTVEFVGGRVIVPEWVKQQFEYLNGDEYGRSESYIRQRASEGYKVLFDPSGTDYLVNILPPNVPDELIEVWWSRVDSQFHSACGEHEDAAGYLTRVDGMGWRVFAVEQ